MLTSSSAHGSSILDFKLRCTDSSWSAANNNCSMSFGYPTFQMYLPFLYFQPGIPALNYSLSTKRPVKAFLPSLLHRYKLTEVMLLVVSVISDFFRNGFGSTTNNSGYFNKNLCSCRSFCISWQSIQLRGCPFRLSFSVIFAFCSAERYH